MLRVLSVLLLVSFPVLAADIAPKYEISAFGGVAKRINGTADGNFGGNFSAGARTMLFIELTGNAGGFDFLDVHAGLKQTLATKGRFQPYVLGGVGVAHTSRALASRSNSLSVNAGFGSRVYIGRRWGIQPEFRWLHLFTEFSGVNLVRTTGVSSSSGENDFRKRLLAARTQATTVQ